MVKTIIAQAPGKVILSGEHAVVHGASAVALAIDRYVKVELTSESKGFFFELPQEHSNFTTSLAELMILEQELNNRYLKFIKNELTIKEVITSSVELVQYAFAVLLKRWSCLVEGGVRIKVWFGFPLGCGLGGSAAMIIALMTAVTKFYKLKPLNMDEYLQLAREIENLQHGNSSGLDLFLAYHGGHYFFSRTATIKRSLSKLEFSLINTGKPKCSTGECVSHTSRFFNREPKLVTVFDQLTTMLDQAMVAGKPAIVSQCIRENHRLLVKLGVVPSQVVDFIGQVEREGGAAKITGGGAIVGEQGGIVLVVGIDQIEQLAGKFGYSVLKAQKANLGGGIV